MTGHIQYLLNYYIYNKEHHQFRTQILEDPYELAESYRELKLSDLERVTRRLEYVLSKEKPIVFKEDKISMLRTVTVLPEIYTPEEMDVIKKEHSIHEQGKVCNISPLYNAIIQEGFEVKRAQIIMEIDKRKQEDAMDKVEFLNCTLRVMTAIENLAKRYKEEAERIGNTVVAAVFSKIPNQKADTFLEALQFFRLMHYSLWCSFNYHNTIGRFDQYMYPYFKRDLENKILTEEQALELLEEFFISFNKDSDLYTGMQQGDNGQSMVLGGLDENGQDTYNKLSDLCMDASLELSLIDPKINLRVSHKTPLALYEKGTWLTKKGLGFPQYSNDDIVIPALIEWGYTPEDAYNYVVAACWEFIIPGVGMDIPNIDGLSFPNLVIENLDKLKIANNFEAFMEYVRQDLNETCKKIVQKHDGLYLEPAPVMSLMMKGCLETGCDISKGNKYNNYGIHGVGLSTAVDSLAAIKKYIYEEESLSKEEVIKALQLNFEGYDELANRLRYEGPKMGNDEEWVDNIACQLLEWFAEALKPYKNQRGGIYRAGTGSAMYYIWHSKEMQATPDGRKKGEAFACNYSPSLFSRCEGPLSIIKSFSKPNLKKVANGGPLTIELHDTLFKNEESIKKVAMLVRTFMELGGHQLQINAVNRETMLDAKDHPEKYRNLIVRVWGWSGYFVELDEVYQDHIIKRMELSID